MCASNIKLAYDAFESLLKTSEGRIKIYSDLQLCSKINNDNDAIMTLSNVNDLFMGTVQGNSYHE